MARARLLIVCTGNSARSQIAEGLFRHEAGDRFEVFSAGTEPAWIRPEAIQVMDEIGIDISQQKAKPVDAFAGQHFDGNHSLRQGSREVPGVPATSRSPALALR